MQRGSAGCPHFPKDTTHMIWQELRCVPYFSHQVRGGGGGGEGVTVEVGERLYTAGLWCTTRATQMRSYHIQRELAMIHSILFTINSGYPLYPVKFPFSTLSSEG